MRFSERARRMVLVAIALVLVVSVVLFLAGCKEQAAAPPAESEATPPPGVTGQTPPPIPEDAMDPMASKPTKEDEALIASIKDIDPAMGRVTEEQQAKLEEVYKKGGPATRKEVLRKLGQLKSPFARKLILQSISDQAADVRIEAFKASAGWKDPEITKARLAALSRASNGMELSRLIQAMGNESKNEQVLQLMVKILEEPRAVDLKSHALGLIESAHYTKALPVVRKYVEEGTGVLPELATQALLNLQVPPERGEARYTRLLQFAIDPAPAIATRAQLQLVEEKTTSEPYVAQQLVASPNPAIRLKASEIMAVIATPKSLPKLTAALGDPDPLVQEQVAKAIFLTKPDAAAVKALGKLMNSKFDYVRAASALALSKSEEAQAIPFLVQGSRDSDEWVRRNSMVGLAKLAKADPAATKPALLSAAGDSDEYVRASAAKGLGTLGASEVKADLLAMLKDSNWRARAAAAEALGDIGAEDCKRELIALLKLDEPEVQHAARKALRKLVF